MTIPVIVLLVMLVLKFAASLVLDLLNISNIRRNSLAVPEAFSSFMDLGTYKKSMAYQ